MSLLPPNFVRSDAESTRRARLLPFLAAAEATVAIFSAVCLWVFVWDATEALLADTALNRLLLAVFGLCGLLWLRSLYNAEELARAVDDESPPPLRRPPPRSPLQLPWPPPLRAATAAAPRRD